MHVPRLWRPRAMRRLWGQRVALQHDDLVKEVGERPRGGQSTHSCADHDGLFADQS
jgi:hypothetical protein